MTITGKQSHNRDQWMGLCEETKTYIRKTDSEGACSNLLKAACRYAGPEYDAHIDLTLANFLHSIDERSSVQLRRELQKLDLSENNLPEWAFEYLKIIISGPPQSKDSRRIAEFRALSLAHPLCLETRFLLAGALNQSACDNEGGEELFKEAISIIKSIKETVSVNPERVAAYRTHSLFEETPVATLYLHHKWVLKNYIYQLQLEGRIKEAIMLLNKEDLNRDPELLALKQLFDIKQGLERKIEAIAKKAQEKVKEAQEAAQGKHIEILGVFAAIIAVFIGLIIPLSNSQVSFPHSISIGFSVLAAMSICLAYLTSSLKQILLRAGIGLGIWAILYFCPFHNNEQSPPDSSNIAQQETVTDGNKAH